MQLSPVEGSQQLHKTCLIFGLGRRLSEYLSKFNKMNPSARGKQTITKGKSELADCATGPALQLRQHVHGGHVWQHQG